MNKTFITLALLCSAIILIGAQTGFAWTNVNQGCLASGCHSAIQIHGVTAHGFSVGNCVVCHSGAPAAGNVNSSTCAGCHTPSATDACELILYMEILHHVSNATQTAQQQQQRLLMGLQLQQQFLLTNHRSMTILTMPLR
jgi:hypothetical protein